MEGVKITRRVVSVVLGVVEFLNMIAGIEVMIFLYVLTVPHMHKFAVYILGDKCGVLNDILSFPLIEKHLDGDGICFDLAGDLLYGFYFVIIGCVCQRVAHFFAHRMYSRYP